MSNNENTGRNFDETRNNAEKKTSDALDETKKVVGSTWEKTNQKGNEMWNDPKGTANSALDKTKQTVGNAWEKTKDAVAGADEDAKKKGTNVKKSMEDNNKGM